MTTAAPHAWLRRVSDYHSGSVPASERAAVEAHLADCAECRLALAAYRRLYTLARSPLRLGDGGEGPLMDYQPLLLEETMLTTDRDTRDTVTRPPRRTALTALGAIAAVLLLAILAGALFAYFQGRPQPVATPHPKVTPTPTLDPQSQAYVTLLRTYYQPLVADQTAAGQCYGLVLASQKVSDLLTCRSSVAALSADLQTLRAQLATANPPARWQTQHAALRQAVDAWIATATEGLAIIDAQDVTGFINTDVPVNRDFRALCPIIDQLNAGPPPLSPSLPYPAMDVC